MPTATPRNAPQPETGPGCLAASLSLHRYFHRSSRWQGMFALALGASMSVAEIQASEADAMEFFERRVRPLLISHCYECHSADESVKGGLVLDSRAGWSIGGDSGPALVPGDPEASLLVQSVRYTDPILQMPPKTRLSTSEVEILEQWVAMGAPDPREGEVVRAQEGLSVEEGRDYWSYRPLAEAEPPLSDSEASHSGIDRFLLAKMGEAGVEPAPQAAPAARLRRLHLDLTGLPPSPEEISAFAADPSEEAWRAEVERLLDSPRFGERWGRHWLDVVRFGESYTLRGLIKRQAWRYRDYVIEAFNRDLPFDQFVREQVAGDLMEANGDFAEAHRRHTATSFLVLGNHNLEEQDKRQLDLDIVDEQLDTLGKAFLGQALSCARCHDHKFDPVPTRDYHAMAGIFASTVSLSHANVSNWLDLPLPLDSAEEERLLAHEARLAALEKELQAAEKEREEAVAADPRGSFERPEIVSPGSLPGIVLDDTDAVLVGEWQHSTHTRSYIGEGYIHDLRQGKGAKSVSFTPPIPKAGRYEVRFAWTAERNRDTAVPVMISSADGDFTVHVDQTQTPPIEGRFGSLGQYRFEANDAGFVLISNEGTSGHVVVDAVQFIPVEELDQVPVAEEPEEDSEAAARRAAAVAEVARIKGEIAKLKREGPERPRYLGVKESESPSDLPVLARGVVHSPVGDPVPRGFLQVAQPEGASLPEIPEGQSGRLQLADWLASPENPLTARVFVNRAWHWMFGSGLTRTVDNFGTTGEEPSHPELLDWLALRFMEEGWSMKWLVREIALTEAYRYAVPEDDRPWAEADPENRLFARAQRRRLEAESIRDSILSVSGRLDLEVGGPTVRPGTGNDYNYEHDSLRRSVYLPALRNSIHEVLQSFDAPNPSLTTGKRDVSTVATQALLMLNHPFVLDEAEAAAKRLLAESDCDVERFELASLRVLGRPPFEDERRLAESLLAAAPEGEREEAWSTLFQALFACLDFRYLD